MSFLFKKMTLQLNYINQLKRQSQTKIKIQDAKL